MFPALLTRRGHDHRAANGGRPRHRGEGRYKQLLRVTSPSLTSELFVPVRSKVIVAENRPACFPAICWRSNAAELKGRFWGR